MSTSSKKTGRVIIHLDADAFFVGCEVSSNPDLRGLPVAVGGVHRGVIASASYEARSLGVYTPMPTARALSICPSLIVLPSDHAKYEDFSRRMFSILRGFSPIVEIRSIDEAYADLSGTTWKTPPLSTAMQLRTRIREEIGISVSIGLGSNKLISSVASKLKKPNGLVEVPPGSEREFLSPLDVTWLPGVGEKMSQALAKIGIKTIADLVGSPSDLLSSVAGSSSSALRLLAQGIDPSPILTDPVPAKSYGCQETFDKNTSDLPLLKNILRSMADALMAKIRKDGKMVRKTEILVRFDDMKQVRRSSTFGAPTDLETEAYGAIDSLLARSLVNSTQVRMIGLKFFDVHKANRPHQPELGFLKTNQKKARTLATVTDEIRHRHGSSAIFRAHRLGHCRNHQT